MSLEMDIEDTWNIRTLYELFKNEKLIYAEYQRNPRIWSNEKKHSLIDTIDRGWDIPKFYFYKTGTDNYEVVDGRQRIEAITEYIRDEFPYSPKHELRSHEGGDSPKKFSQLSTDNQNKILDYKLTPVIIEGDIVEDELNLLFFKLQLGEALNTGEKLNAMTGNMRDYIFGKEKLPEFFNIINAPERRFGRQVLFAQIVNNLFNLREKEKFARSRFKDLKLFFAKYSDVQLPDGILSELEDTLKTLENTLGDFGQSIRSKGMAISVFFRVNEIMNEISRDPEDEIKKFYKFLFNNFLERLAWQLDKGFTPDQEYIVLLEFNKYLTQAAAEHYSIQNRHDLLTEYFTYFKDKGKIKGDIEYKERTGKEPGID